MSSVRRTDGVHQHELVTIFAASALMTALHVFIVNVGLSELGRDVGQGSLDNDLSFAQSATARSSASSVTWGVGVHRGLRVRLTKTQEASKSSVARSAPASHNCHTYSP